MGKLEGLFEKYERTAIIIITLIITVSFINSAFTFGDLMRDYTVRMITYISFAIIFIFVLKFRKEVIKKWM